MMHEFPDGGLGLQVIISVVVVAVSAHRAVKALHDAIRFWVPGSRFDIDQVVRLDDRSDISIHEFAAMIVHDPGVGPRRTFTARSVLLMTQGSKSDVHEIPYCSMAYKSQS